MKSSSEGMPDPIQEEINLILRMSRRDSQAWQRFLSAYENVIYATVFYTLRRYIPTASKDDVNDAVQDLFVAISADDCRKLHTFQGKKGCSLKSWLQRVARNHVLSWVRGHKDLISLDSPAQYPDEGIPVPNSLNTLPTVLEGLEEEDRLKLLKSVVDALTTKEQIVFGLYYESDLTRTEVADILGITPNNFDQIIHRIRNRLKELLSPKADM